ncbi:MAG: amidase [Pseudomonadota bacterium]
MSEFWRWPARAVAALVRSRAVSAREIAEDALARLDAVNPTLNAVVDGLAGPARDAADQIDRRIAAGDDVGPLAGVPVTVKVNTDLSGNATTNGLRLQADLLAQHDSPVVSNLRRAGAIIIGRTSTPAFSMRWFTRSALYGQTLNPQDPALTPGGSSGGAGAAVAAGIGAIAHGTDIAGSIRYPAYACGVHGLRPTLGRVPAANLSGPERSGGAQIMAVSGPLARSIDDLEAAFKAMSAADPRDPWWMPAPHDLPGLPHRAALCLRPGGMEIAPQVEAALTQAAARLSAQGWEVGPAEPPGFRDAAALSLTLWASDLRATCLPRLDAEADPDTCLMAPRLIAADDRALDTDAALRERAALLRAWQLFFEEWPLLIAPVSGMLPFPNNLDVGPQDAFDTVLAAQLPMLATPVLGLPSVSVSTGSAGAPNAVQLIASRFREDVLFGAARAIAAPVAAIDPLGGA